MCTQTRIDTEASDECGICAGRVILPFLAGVLMGAGLSLLYAPKSGKELREKIGEMTDVMLLTRLKTTPLKPRKRLNPPLKTARQ